MPRPKYCDHDHSFTKGVLYRPPSPASFSSLLAHSPSKVRLLRGFVVGKNSAMQPGLGILYCICVLFSLCGTCLATRGGWRTPCAFTVTIGAR